MTPTHSTMRFLTTRVHGALDYLLGILLITGPWVLGFARGGAESWVPVALGILILGYSAITDYELGLMKRLQIPMHLWLDALVGATLVVSPWLFDFDQHVWVPHVALGVAAMAVAFLSDTIPGYERRAPGARGG